jgi:hypothetical protein
VARIAYMARDMDGPRQEKRKRLGQQQHAAAAQAFFLSIDRTLEILSAFAVSRFGDFSAISPASFFARRALP